MPIALWFFSWSTSISGAHAQNILCAGGNWHCQYQQCLLLVIFHNPNNMNVHSLVPRPHPRGGKGSGELGQNPWACAEEFPRANEILALAQSYDKLTAGMQRRHTICIAIQFRRPIRFKVCFTAGCGHAITCKRSHSDQSEPSFEWRCQHICACAVEREPRIQPKFTRPFSSFWGWGLGTRLERTLSVW